MKKEKSENPTETTEGEKPKKAVGRGSPPYVPGQKAKYPLSRSKISDFFVCPRCFFMDLRHKTKPPSGPTFALNNAVDALMKREFDTYRVAGKPHPLMKQAEIVAVPFQHPEFEDWRNTRKGLRVLHEKTGFEVFGAVDDIWQEKDATGRLIVADYKCTAKKDDVNSMEGGWGPGYKRQAEIYQWILRKKGFDVAPTAWFVYANGCSDKAMFGEKLEFRMTMIRHEGETEWVDGTLRQIKALLEAPQAPERSETCGHCKFLAKIKELGQ